MADAEASTPTPPAAPGAAPGAAKRKRGFFRGLLKFVLWTIAIVLLLVLAVFVFLQTRPGKDLVRDIVLGVLNDTFRGRMEVDEIGGFLPFDAVLIGVRAYDPDGKIVMDIERVTADFHPLGLLDSEIHLSDVRVTRPTISIFDAQNRIALLRAFEPRIPSTDDSPMPWIVTFERVHLAEGRLDGLVPGEDFALTELQLDVTLGLSAEGLQWPKVEVRGRPVGTSELVAMVGGDSQEAGLIVIRTSGGLSTEAPTTTEPVLEGMVQAQTLRLDTFEVVAGEHALALTGAVLLGEPMVADVDITDLRVALDRLPRVIRDQLMEAGTLSTLAGSDLQGKGRASIDAQGEVSLDLSLSTPYGLAILVAGATIYAPGSSAFELGDWAATLELVDVVPPPAVRAKLPQAVRPARADIHIEAFGRKLPLAHDGTLRVELGIQERAPHDDGKLELVLTRIENDPFDGASTFEATLGIEGLDMQPWLAIVGEPEITGQVSVLYADGKLALPPSGLPRLAATASFDLDAKGRIVAIDKTFQAPHLAGTAHVQWSGVGLPSGRIDVTGLDLGFDLGGVQDVALGFDIRARGDGVPEIEGKVSANGLKWDEMTIATLEVPLDIVLDGFGSPEMKPSGHVAFRVTGVDLGDQKVASASGDYDITHGPNGIHLRGVTRSGKVRIGGGVDLGVSKTDILVDAYIAPGDDGALVGGPITARVAGDIYGVTQGAQRVDKLHFDDLRVVMPRGPTGPIDVQGDVRAEGITTPDVTARRAEIDVDVRIDPTTIEVTGDAHVEVRRIVLSQGERLGRVQIDVTAEKGGKLTFTGSAQRGREGAKDEAGKPVDILVTDFQGTAILPGPNRELAVTVDKLTLGKLGDPTKILFIDGATFDGQWVTLQALSLKPNDEAGTIDVVGRFRPRDGAVEATVDVRGLVIPQWVDLFSDAFTWVGKPRPKGIPDRLDGIIDLKVEMHGSLARPEVTAALDVTQIKWGTRDGAGAKADLHIGASGVQLLAALQWHEGGNLSVEASLPAQLSLSPAGLTWDDAGQMRLALAVDESDLSQVFAWADALSATGVMTGDELRERTGTEGLDGALRFDLIVEGTPVDPVLRTTMVGYPIDVGDWKGGTLLMEGSASGDASAFRMEMFDARDALQARIDIQLPFAIARMLRRDDPVAWVRSELERKEFAIELDLPSFVVAETPLVAVMPEAFIDMVAKVDLTLAGTLVKPIVGGTVSLMPPATAPMDLGFSLAVGTQGETVEGTFVMAKQGGEPLLDGSFAVPRLGKILQDPAAAGRLLNDPELRIDIQSADIASFDFWEINQSIGDLAMQMFPDGRVLLDVSAKGSDEGLVATVMTRIRTVTPKNVTPAAKADSTAVRRNAADDVRLAVLVGPEETTLSLVLVQDAPSVAPYLSVQAKVAMGPRKLLSGAAFDVMTVPVEGRVIAGDFRLEGFASAFREVLGTSGGQLTGDLGISGTIGSPRFERSLVAQFQPIVVAPLGIEHDWATVNIDFTNGTEWEVIVSELYDLSRKTSVEPVSRCGVTPLKTDSIDNSVHPYLAIKLSGSIPTLDPKRMTIKGCVGLRDYPALAKSDMRGRVDGQLELSGTIAAPQIVGKLAVVEAVIAPKLASKTVRPIGNPLDVTIVRGAPKAPPVKPEKNPYKIPVVLDIEVSIPKDAVRLEPSLTQAYGEVRALLYPNGSIRIRTIGGELALFGTIDVPRERVFLYGRDFLVDPESRIVFTGDMTSDPQLFFTARYNIEHVDLQSIGLVATRESEVVVRVTGTPTAPRLRFSSTPAMDETNILSVIALGVPAGGGGAVGEAVSAQLFTAVMGMATLQFARDFQQRLALDVLRIEARSADPSESRLTVGKRLAEDLILNYYLDLAAKDDEDVNSGSLEYRLTRYLSILGRAGDGGDVGLELNLRFQD